MKNLSPLPIKCIDEFEKIRLAKESPTKGRLLILKPSVQQRYDEYDKKFKSNQLESISENTYSSESKADLLHCYKVSTKPLEQLITLIRENQEDHIKRVCQYCGINSDDTMDHYLPKERYPEFCVKSLNLIPCCPRCNQLKGEYWKDKNDNKRGIINLYLDSLPTEQYLFLDLHYNPILRVFGVSFYLDNTSNIDADFFSIIERHYTKLHLLKKYEDRFNHVYQKIYSSFTGSKIFQGNSKIIKQFLLDETNGLKRDFGVNYYKTVITDALANNDDFIRQF
ncbi:HNH endonuclease [Chryseobacterium sp. HMWF035]|uniref:HNH endonuclease n=2 Tax=unclassified Chryseobacterium TaxID=2593645 RepID=UPI000D564544|nr:HNH endonuclease [Chryseobacterium sp. HMWF035]PVV50786.1 hypothetical protein DD829_21520 [Chryseobacterium sp. HMWF035]